MKCPNCKKNILQKSANAVKIRSDGPIHIDANGNARARCYWCRAEVDLPIELKKAYIEEEFVVHVEEAS